MFNFRYKFDSAIMLICWIFNFYRKVLLLLQSNYTYYQYYNPFRTFQIKIIIHLKIENNFIPNFNIRLLPVKLVEEFCHYSCWIHRLNDLVVVLSFRAVGIRFELHYILDFELCFQLTNNKFGDIVFDIQQCEQYKKSCSCEFKKNMLTLLTIWFFVLLLFSMSRIYRAIHIEVK